MIFPRTICLFALAILSPAFSLLHTADTNSLDGRRAQLNQLIAEEWEYELRESPELATMIGDYRYNDRWSDPSLAHAQQQKKDAQDWLARWRDNPKALERELALTPR